MYAAAHPNGADGATINPAALNSDPAPASRGLKRSRSPDDDQDAATPGSAGGDVDKSSKRGRSMKSRSAGSVAEADHPGHYGAAPVPSSHHLLDRNVSPSTSIATLASVSVQTVHQPPYGAPLQSQPPQVSPPRPTPAKSNLKALPTVRDHTTDQLGDGGHEYLPRESDEGGELKVQWNGELNDGREYKMRTFHVPNRGERLFMLATECARVLGYRDSYLLFNKNRSLYKIIANQEEKDALVNEEILPFSYRSRQIAIVTARSMFRQFGSRVIKDGHRVRDDYWEAKARKQGFTEQDLAGDKRPGGARLRETPVASSQAPSMIGTSHGDVIYTGTPGPYGGPQLSQSDYTEVRTRNYSGILKSGPRQEITGPPYSDRTVSTTLSEVSAHSHQAAEYNRSMNHQRGLRDDYMQTMWRRPHEQPPSSLAPSSIGTSDVGAAGSRTAPSPHTSAASLQQPSMMTSQSPQMLMTAAAPYSQPIHAQNPAHQSPMRGGSVPPNTQNYQYTQSQMWPPTPQTPSHGYQAYTAQTQSPAIPQQSPAPPIRHGSGSSQAPGSMSYMGQHYSQPAQAMYPTEQTPRQYMHQTTAGAPTVTQAWSQPPPPQPAQWWPNSPQ